jgi:ubiquinone/menaquinone biosynthesis C-methylase UbiE
MSRARSTAASPFAWTTAVQVTLILGTILCLLYFLMRGIRHMADASVGQTPNAETFANPTPPIEDVDEATLATYTQVRKRTHAGIYDPFYARAYRELVDNHRTKALGFEIRDLQARTQLAEYGRKAVILDMGCGTGSHVRRLAQAKPAWMVYGLDQSRAMLDVAQSRLKPYRRKTRLIRGDFEDPDAFDANTFTHITCYYFSIYYAKQPATVFANAHKWLKPGGYLCVHVVDPERFDPVLDAANPLVGISLQKYMQPGERRTHSKVYFTNFVYKSDFVYDAKTRTGTFTEVFTHPKKQRVRTHTHTLSMVPHNTLIGKVRKAGFKLKHVTKMFEIGDEYEYLCYFQKT